MAVEKLVTFNALSISIIDTLTHALIAEGFSLVDLDQKKGFISGSVATQKFLQNLTISVYPIPDGSLVRILCTARPETSVPGVAPGTNEDGQDYEGPCRNTLGIILDQTGDWREVSSEWAKDQGIQLEIPQHTQQSARTRLAKSGLWGGLAVIILGSLLAFLTLSERMKLASPQVWIMVAVIGVFIFCFSLFSLTWR